MRRWYFCVLFILGIIFAGGYVLYRTSYFSVSDRIAGEFGSVSLMLEVARTPKERGQGLSGRENLARNEGMLFAFKSEGTYGIWMKDTLIPLDIFWLDAQGAVIHLEKNVVPETYPNVFYSSIPARYVLETNAGFADENSIVVGTRLFLQNWPSVSE